MKKIFMAVTADKYELPVFIADTIPELARKLKVPAASIRSSICRGDTGKTRGIKFIKVII